MKRHDKVLKTWNTLYIVILLHVLLMKILYTHARAYTISENDVCCCIQNIFRTIIVSNDLIVK